jgi:hypothetical protein
MVAGLAAWTAETWAARRAEPTAVEWAGPTAWRSVAEWAVRWVVDSAEL